ncbi:hypothetical protein A8B75_10570 [Sphingomonadales bacterium EhC05]|nr:hypothetical protein A8B75_10570 [Sphingomonadales bacterium EhC05]
MITITGSTTTTLENHREIIDLCVEHSLRSRGEPGCLMHNIHIDCEDPSRLFFYELWQDDQAVSKHFEVAESLEFVQRLTRLVGSRPEMKIYRTAELSPGELR